MKLEALRLLLTIVEEGSLAAAGRRLNLPKSVVSDRLAELEQEIGARLLQRTARSMRLTEAGVSFHAVAARVMEDLDEALDGLAERRGELRGMLRVTAPVTFGLKHLCPVLNVFLQTHPRVQLDLELNDRFVDLISDGFDLAVRIGELPDSSLIARRLGTSHRVVVAGAGYAAERGLPRNVSELEQHPAISYANIGPRDEWQFATEDGKQTFARPRVRVRVNNGQAQMNAVASNLGLAVLPMFIVNEMIKSGSIVAVDLGARPVPDPIHALYSPGRSLSNRTRVFIDCLVDSFSELMT